MKILHTADLHLGQVLYQNYDRVDEHQHFLQQLHDMCVSQRPDALLVCGDVYDIPMPSVATRGLFNKFFTGLHAACPEMAIVVIAGNHDSASRLHVDRPLWQCAGMSLCGLAPTGVRSADGWQQEYITRLSSGYIITVPYSYAMHTDAVQSLLDLVAAENVDSLPVVMMAHQALADTDTTGHDLTIGTLNALAPEALGHGWDYLALGHIHKPQTLGYPRDQYKDSVTYPSGVARYSGSALHVSCDEKYPHTVTLVELTAHSEPVTIRQLPIRQLRHFYELPADSYAYTSEAAALQGVDIFCKEGGRGYIRLKIDVDVNLSADFNQKIYKIIEQGDFPVRYNPKILWSGEQATVATPVEDSTFEVAELQQMTDPMQFIERTADQYGDFSVEELTEIFKEVEQFMSGSEK